MTGIVEELQSDAIFPDVDVSTLLRKALVVASKLGLAEFKQWVSLELEGYRGVEVPEYRQIRGRVIVPGRFGPTSMAFEDPEIGDLVSTHHMRAPVGPLQELVRSSPNSEFGIDFPAEMQNLLMAPYAYLPGIPQLRVNRSSLMMIFDAVRNAILNWSLRLQEDGIVGEGMSFTSAEVAAARQNAAQLQPPIIIVGSMSHSTIQQASPGASANDRI